MASRGAAKRSNADDYAKVYKRGSQVREPVIIHWLATCFDRGIGQLLCRPSLDAAMDFAVGVINANAPNIIGVRFSAARQAARDRPGPAARQERRCIPAMISITPN